MPTFDSPRVYVLVTSMISYQKLAAFVAASAMLFGFAASADALVSTNCSSYGSYTSCLSTGSLYSPTYTYPTTTYVPQYNRYDYLNTLMKLYELNQASTEKAKAEAEAAAKAADEEFFVVFGKSPNEAELNYWVLLHKGT